MHEWVDQQLAKDGWPRDPLMEILRERGIASQDGT